MTLASTTAIQRAAPFLRVLAGERRDPVPIWLMRQAGRYLAEYRAVREQAGGFLNLCLTPELAAEVTLQPIRRYGFDAAIVFADILLIPHALGQEVGFVAGEGPVLAPIHHADQVARLGPADGVDDDLAPVYQTLRILRETLPADVALIGFAGAPWTVATYMVEGRSGHDFAQVLAWALEAPETFQALIDRVVEATVVYLRGQIDAGADALQLFDTWAGMLPGDARDRWCVEPTARIVAAMKQYAPSVPVIGFPKGLGTDLVDFAARTGVDAVSIDQHADRAAMAAALPSGLTVQGNLDPQVLIAGGQAMRDQACDVLQAFAGRPHVFNLGHGIDKTTPPDHVAELVETVRAWQPNRG